MRYTTSVASLLALNNLVPVDASDVISMPIRYLYGELNKITTSVMVGQGNEEIGQSIEVVVDYGSSDFWVRDLWLYFCLSYQHIRNLHP